MRKVNFILFALVAVCFVASDAVATSIVINNVDDPNQGFNDPTPVAPLPSNPGTTIGAQRLHVFQTAADIWEAALDSDIEVVVQSTFQDRGFTPCTATGAVLGAAGAIQIFADFDNAFWPTHWYKVALANKLAGADQAPGGPDPDFLAPPFADDIIAFFNPNLGQANCLPGGGWYYGTDNNEPAGSIDLLNVVLHEIGHGLGFANDVDEDGSPTAPPGSGPLGLPDVYSAYTHDNDTGKNWNQMTDAERAASAVNTNDVVWNGPVVTGEAGNVLSNKIDLTITSGTAAGTTLSPLGTGGPTTATPANFNGAVTYVNDGTAPVNDGCQPYAAIVGIAMVDRGTCTFEIKAQNAISAGASALLVVNNAGGDVVQGMAITSAIPSLMISTVDGLVVKNNLPATVALVEDPTQLAGADPDGQVLLNAPNPVAPGSSISHWDPQAIPNLLMEPAINADLQGATTLDLTDEQMFDIGWDGNLHCPNNSDDSPTVVLNGCDTGVTNTEGPYTVFPGPNDRKITGPVAAGCTLADVFNYCSTHTKNIGTYSACVDKIATPLRKAGVITSQESDAIKACF